MMMLSNLFPWGVGLDRAARLLNLVLIMIAIITAWTKFFSLNGHVRRSALESFVSGALTGLLPNGLDLG